MKFDLKAFEVAADLLAGPALTLAGVPAAYVGIITSGIKAAEQLAVPGSNKKNIVLDLVDSGLQALGVSIPQTITQPVQSAVLQAASAGIDVAVSTINAYLTVQAAKANTGAGVTDSAPMMPSTIAPRTLGALTKEQLLSGQPAGRPDPSLNPTSR